MVEIKNGLPYWDYQLTKKQFKDKLKERKIKTYEQFKKSDVWLYNSCYELEQIIFSEKILYDNNLFSKFTEYISKLEIISMEKIQDLEKLKNFVDLFNFYRRKDIIKSWYVKFLIEHDVIKKEIEKEFLS